MRTRLRVALLALAGLQLAVPACRPGGTLEVDGGRVARRNVFRSTVTASGEIVAVRYADLGSSVMGKLVSLPVREGDRVREGQVVARIDPVPAASDAEAAVAHARAVDAEEKAAAALAVDAARALERAKRLHEQGLLPRADLEGAEAGDATARARLEAAGRRLAQARAQLARAQDLVQKTKIVSPLTGTVTRLPVREGEIVVVGVQNMPGTTIMTISDLSEINAEVKVAEADILTVREGQPATVTLEAMPGGEYAGEVVEVGASALPVVGTGSAAREFKVAVRLRQPGEALRPGLTCDAEILVGESRDVLTVPLQAVMLRGEPGEERSGVFVVEDSRARFLPVETGLIGGLEIEVRGVQEAQEIVVGPWQALRDLQEGAPLRSTLR